MKLLIQEDLIFNHTVPETEEEAREFMLYCEELIENCKKFHIFYKITQVEKQVTFTVLAQKVCLEDLDMNVLFAHVLSEFEYNLKYAALGGEGCSMSLEITNAKAVM